MRLRIRHTWHMRVLYANPNSCRSSTVPLLDYQQARVSHKALSTRVSSRKLAAAICTPCCTPANSCLGSHCNKPITDPPEGSVQHFTLCNAYPSGPPRLLDPVVHRQRRLAHARAAALAVCATRCLSTSLRTLPTATGSTGALIALTGDRYKLLTHQAALPRMSHMQPVVAAAAPGWNATTVVRGAYDLADGTVPSMAGGASPLSSMLTGMGQQMVCGQYQQQQQQQEVTGKQANLLRPSDVSAMSLNTVSEAQAAPATTAADGSQSAALATGSTHTPGHQTTTAEVPQAIQQSTDSSAKDEAASYGAMQDSAVQEKQGASTAAAVAAATVGKAQKPKKAPKPRPTHFMALQVSHSPEVIASMGTIQQKLIETDPLLQHCCLEPMTAHITIMVLYLPTQVQLDAAGVALAELGSVLTAKGLSAPFMLQLKGLSHFKHQVLYLDVAPGPARDSLMTLGSTVIEHFSAAAGGSLLVPGEDKPFIPHITVAKTSRLMGRHRKGGRQRGVSIPESARHEFAELDIGHVSIDKIQICSMQGRKPGQYYKVTHTLELVQPPSKAPPPPSSLAAVRKHGPLAAARKRFRRLLSAVTCGGVKRHKGNLEDSKRQ